jgi:hypothetical protein
VYGNVRDNMGTQRSSTTGDMASPSGTQRPVTRDIPGTYPQDIRTSVDSTRRTIFGHGLNSIAPDQQKMTEGEGTQLEVG